MGWAHGRALGEQIRVTPRSGSPSPAAPWTGHAPGRDEVLALAQTCVSEHESYAPDLMDELAGIAEATGLGVAELIIMQRVYRFHRSGLCAVAADDRDGIRGR